MPWNDYVLEDCRGRHVRTMNRSLNLRLGEEEERILRRIPLEIIFFSLFVAVISQLFYDWIIGILIFAGGIVAAINFIWLRQAITHYLSSGKQKALRSALAVYVLRLLLILAIFFIIILFFSTKIIAFVVGFSTLVLVFLIEAIRGLSKLKKWNS
jgi:hypothetical protein